MVYTIVWKPHAESSDKGRRTSLCQSTKSNKFLITLRTAWAVAFDDRCNAPTFHIEHNGQCLELNEKNIKYISLRHTILYKIAKSGSRLDETYSNPVNSICLQRQRNNEQDNKSNEKEDKMIAKLKSSKKKQLKLYSKIGSQLLEIDESWFAVSKQWMNEWKSYLDGLKDSVEPINNRRINLNNLENVEWVHNEDYQIISKLFGTIGNGVERKVFREKSRFNKRCICISPIMVKAQRIYSKQDVKDGNYYVETMQFPKDSSLVTVVDYLGKEMKLSRKDCVKKRNLGNEHSENIHIWCRLKDVMNMYTMSRLASELKVNVNLSTIEKLDGNKWVEVASDYLSNVKLKENMQLLIEYGRLIQNVFFNEEKGYIEWPLGKSLTDWKHFEIGDIIDCCDSKGIWREALIRNVLKNESGGASIAVHYIGCDIECDEWVNVCGYYTKKICVARRNVFTNCNNIITNDNNEDDEKNDILEAKDDNIFHDNDFDNHVSKYEVFKPGWIWIHRSQSTSYCDALICDDTMSFEFDRLSIGLKTLYTFDSNKYYIKKLSRKCVSTINLETNEEKIYKREFNVYYIWKFKDENNKTAQCDTILCIKLNNMYIGQSINYNIGSWSYRAHRLNCGIIEQTNNKTNTKRILYRSKWNDYNNDENNSQTYYEQRFGHNKELIEIGKKFHETIDHSKLEIINIAKCNNDNEIYKMVYDSILVTKQKHGGKNGKEIEKTLFHGTLLSKVNKIVKNGFNRDFNQRSLLGKGVYFARDAKYSADYCDKIGTREEQKMFACRVLIGDYCVGNSSMTTPPNKANGIDEYEMMVDNVYNPTIYVVTKDYHAIPSYTITFHKRVLL